ncbi:MAG: 7TM domain-containing protein [Patescibacteria group bacterium]
MGQLSLFLIQSGINQNALYILLAIPVVALFIVFIRQVIGFETFNLYMTVLSIIAFFSTGLLYGIFFVLYILIFEIILKYLIKNFTLHHTAREALTISFISFAIIASLYSVHAIFNYHHQISIYAILILMLLGESLATMKIKKGERHGNYIYLQTIIIGLLIYIIIGSTDFRIIIIKYPVLSLIAIIFDIYIGRVTSLRLTEFFRFRKLIKD